MKKWFLIFLNEGSEVTIQLILCITLYVSTVISMSEVDFENVSFLIPTVAWSRDELLEKVRQVGELSKQFEEEWPDKAVSDTTLQTAETIAKCLEPICDKDVVLLIYPTLEGGIAFEIGDKVVVDIEVYEEEVYVLKVFVDSLVTIELTFNIHDAKSFSKMETLLASVCS